MRRNNTNMKNVARKLAVCGLLLFAFAGRALAQTEGQFVIKIDGHYLSHAGNMLQDATEFSPDCLWTSDNAFISGGTNKNYYYFDGTNYRFLCAPDFQAYGALALSNALPSPLTLLNNPESPYYFYQWDNGLGRGIQIFGVTQQECEEQLNGWDTEVGECWEVYWVSYNATDNTWKLSEKSYNITPNGGKFYAVTITEHTQDTTLVSGGLGNLTVPAQMVWGGAAASLSASIMYPYNYSFTQAYTTYEFQNGVHNYYGGSDHLNTVPTSTPGSGNSVSNYAWSLSGEGAEFLTLANANTATPTLSYTTQNNIGHKTATITLTVTYNDGSKQTTTASVLVVTPCQNPIQAAAPVVTYVGVTVSWVPTAEEYTVSWTKSDESDWTSVTVGEVTSYTITGLEYLTDYDYKVQVDCDSNPPQPYHFTTKAEPGLMVTGNIFGGGRMANVGGNTEIVIINCDSIGGIFGGNDIAGVVEGANGSKITLGVNEGDPNNYDEDYDTTPNDVLLKFGSIYGGGNGYYGYNGNPIVQAAYNTIYPVAIGNTIIDESGAVVWTNDTGAAMSFVPPTIQRSNILVTDNYVQIDSLFGGAKNAILSESYDEDVLITINGGTIAAVFGGNNYGGDLGYHGQENIVVNKTTVKTTVADYNNTDYVMGRDFGIGYLFGGGNKVYGQHANITINGGQIDNLFGGGNSADLRSTEVKIQCDLGALTNGAYGQVYTAALNSNYSGGDLTDQAIDANYPWNCSGIYNVRTLFGGNNQAEMEGVPTITLTSGSIGTVYGGGNAGNMAARVQGSISCGTGYPLGDLNFDYSTYVEMNSSNILVDYLYGGCRMSDVFYSTFVALKKGHVGTVYGGCNISGDVGSTLNDLDAPLVPHQESEQEVHGSTYVEASENIIVYNDLFAGSNGYYDCSTDGITYNSDTYFDDPVGQYAGRTVPTHNMTHAVIKDGAHIKGNVYAGGNLACVGFDDNTGYYRSYPELVGLASVRMLGGTVDKNVYGGGNMASVFGINEVRVSGGTIGLALYGGNDRAGQVAEKTNRILPSTYQYASDNATNLESLGVKTYVGVSGDPQIGTVYGGGNGDYPPGSVQYCHEDDAPIQPYTFVDINIDGGSTGGKIGIVYGGGNGVTVRRGATVFYNVVNPDYAHNNVDTIFGGNNKGDLDIVADIILLHGQVGTVYGGCNRGAMAASASLNLKTIEGYEDIGSYVRLLETYQASPSASPVGVDAKVTEAVYGGCRMNGVTKNSLVYVKGGNHSTIPIYGGSDIQGNVGGISQVVVSGGTAGNIYGGGNGDYDYTSGTYSGLTPPNSNNSRVDVISGAVLTGVYGGNNAQGNIVDLAEVNITGGTIGTDATHTADVFGGGYGPNTTTTGNVYVTVNGETALIYGDVYGGSALGQVGNEASDLTKVTLTDGTIHGNLYGGGMGQTGTAVDGRVNGKVEVYVNGGTVDNVFGCNNYNEAPQGTVTVTVNDGTVTNNVYGGGNVADYTAPSGNYPFVNIKGGTVSHKVVGGGNEASITGSTYILVEGGHIGTNAANDAGIYGGCNTTGTVSGNTTVTLTGGEIGTTSSNAYVFGGGYGEPTNVAGNVTVNFGEIVFDDETDDEVHNPNLILYGELYGGSALGKVNTADISAPGATASTNVNLLNGIINGTAYGGGLGQRAGVNGATTNISASVYGKVYVKVGNVDSGDPTIYYGEANLVNCSVYGCNNLNGSPQSNVEVHVYKTNHTPDNVYDNLNGTYAVNQVFGGGNQADYVITSGDSGLKELVYVHGCENTIWRLFGGGNAAAVYGVNLNIDGGRFDQVFGGGNGELGPDYAANIEGGGIDINLGGGYMNLLFNGSNMYGDVSDHINLTKVESPCGDALIFDHYMGSNQAPIFGSIEETIPCDTDPEKIMRFVNLYCGSNKAQIYGDINLTIEGGIFENVFGGSKGSLDDPTTTIDESYASNVHIVTQAMIYEFEELTQDKLGTGGNINLFIHGGTIGDLYGACDINGNVEGRITITVQSYDHPDCPLFIGNIYGGGNRTDYNPINISNYNSTDYPGYSPLIKVRKGTIGGSCPELPILESTANPRPKYYEGNVFGGGNHGNVVASPIVVIGPDPTLPVTIKGSVYGGGNEGNVDGSPKVIIGTEGN